MVTKSGRGTVKWTIFIWKWTILFSESGRSVFFFYFLYNSLWTKIWRKPILSELIPKKLSVNLVRSIKKLSLTPGPIYKKVISYTWSELEKSYQSDLVQGYMNCRTRTNFGHRPDWYFLKSKRHFWRFYGRWLIRYESYHILQNSKNDVTDDVTFTEENSVRMSAWWWLQRNQFQLSEKISSYRRLLGHFRTRSTWFN